MSTNKKDSHPHPFFSAEGQKLASEYQGKVSNPSKKKRKASNDEDADADDIELDGEPPSCSKLGGMIAEMKNENQKALMQVKQAIQSSFQKEMSHTDLKRAHGEADAQRKAAADAEDFSTAAKCRDLGLLLLKQIDILEACDRAHDHLKHLKAVAVKKQEYEKAGEYQALMRNIVKIYPEVLDLRAEKQALEKEAAEEAAATATADPTSNNVTTVDLTEETEGNAPPATPPEAPPTAPADDRYPADNRYHDAERKRATRPAGKKLSNKSKVEISQHQCDQFMKGGPHQAGKKVNGTRVNVQVDPKDEPLSFKLNSVWCNCCGRSVSWENRKDHLASESHIKHKEAQKERKLAQQPLPNNIRGQTMLNEEQKFRKDLC